MVLSTSSIFPTTLKALQLLPQLGIITSSPGSEKFFALLTPAAPIRPSLASLFVSGVASQMHVRSWHTAFRDQATRTSLVKHMAPCIVHFTPSRPPSGVSAEGPHGPFSSISCVGTVLKPCWGSARSRAREVIAYREPTHSNSVRSICSCVHEVASLSPAAHAASISLRMASPADTLSWLKPRFSSAKDTTPSPSVSTCAKRKRIFSRRPCIVW
mmetsp:Transcript_20418/g.57454  ORF Transcript_20418/g.57454 Transcript_20418/m.57454 type:complete len:214 (-) Transcript_20418:190-831(-)